MKKFKKTLYETLIRRFKRLTSITIVLFLIVISVLSTRDSFPMILFALSVAFWGWLFFDYQVLQYNQMYYSSVLVGVAFFLFGVFVKYTNPELEKIELIFIGTTMPIFFLLLQRPLRLFFIRIIGREPVVDKPAPTFPDFIYIFTLFLTSFLVPTFYYI